MQTLEDIKPIFEWAIKNGEAKIVDRILVKLLPQLLKAHSNITAADVKESAVINVSAELYELVKKSAEELIGSSFGSKGPENV
ncbi:MAG TPA: hypothetical protein PLV58_01310 [Campylobacterales bacterium]|nr:hypothetical protein [Campylobacterales bacterium]